MLSRMTMLIHVQLLQTERNTHIPNVIPTVTDNIIYESIQRDLNSQ